MSGSNPLAAALGQVGSTNPLQYAAGYADLATKAQALKASQFQLGQAQLQPGYSAIRMLQATNPNPSDDDVNAALGAAARQPNANVDPIVQDYTAWRARGGTAADFVRSRALGGMSPAEQYGQTGPQFQARQTDQGTYYGVVGGPATPNANVFQGTGFVARGLSPEAQTTPIIVGYKPDGTPITQSRGAAYGDPYGGGGGGPAAGGPSQGGGQGTSASQATNNFGNIRAPGGGFASYATPQDGVAAMASNLTAYQDLHGINTLNGITARWAPQGDGANNPAAYARTISQLTGIDPNTPLDLHDPATLAKIIPAMAQVEHGRPMGVGGDVLNAGISSALSGRGVAAAPGAQQGGPFIGATSAQPVGPGGAVAQPGGNVRPAGGMQYFPASPGGGGGYGGGAGPGSLLGPGQTVTGLPPTFGKTAEASADMFNTARASYAQQAQRISPLEQSLATLRAHPDLQTGMTAMDFQNLNSLAQVLGVQLPPETIADGSALTEINKNLNRYYRGLPGANRSDMAELDAKLANPSPENQRDALEDLLARTIGTERMNDAGYMHFLEQHGDGNASTYAGQYADQTGQYTSKLDPVGFAFDKMTVQQRRAYWDGLSPAERTRYMNSIKEASRLYNLPIPQGGG